MYRFYIRLTIEEIDDIKKYGTTIYIREEASKLGYIDYTNSHKIFLGIKDTVLYKGVKLKDLEYLKKITNIKKSINHPLISIKYTKTLDYLNHEYSDNEDSKNGYFWSPNGKSAIKFNFIEEDKENHVFSRSPTLKYRGQVVGALKDFKASQYFPEIFKIKTLYFTIDIYGAKASEVISLSRETIIDSENVNSIIKVSYDDLMNHVKNNGSQILDTMFNGNRKLSSLFMNFGNNSINPKDDLWKKTGLPEGLIIDDLLSSTRFTSVTNRYSKLEPFSQLLNINNIITFESYLMQSLLANNNFQNLLIEQGFSKYKIQKQGEKDDNRYLYSKEPTDAHLKTIKKVSYNHNHTKIETIEKFYELFNFRHVEMPSIHLQQIMEIEVDSINNSFFSDSIKCNLTTLLNKNFTKGPIIIPFLRNKDMSIIEIPNEQLIQLANASNEMEEEINQVYTDLKFFIINKAKEQGSVWYKEYVQGKNFEAVDLSDLDKLHKSAT